MAKNESKPHRPLYEIAAEVRSDWEKVYFGAEPYLDAMSSLNQVGDNYGMDTGDSIVRYFLSNAATWRGEVAKRVKNELKKLFHDFFKKSLKKIL